MREKRQNWRLIRRPMVLERIGLRTTQLYQLVKDNQFPKPVPLGKRAVAWVEAEVDAWIEARIQERSEKTERQA